MKKAMLLSILCAALVSLAPVRAEAQIGIIGEVLKRVIMAIDLRVQRLQTQTIVLQEAQKQVENLMQATQLGAITDWVQRQKDLYEGYYRELWEVKNALLYYSKVKDMIERETQLVKKVQRVSAAARGDPHFSPAELDHIARVLDGTLQESIRDIGQLSVVIRGFVTQMDDGERLRIINELAARIDAKGQALEQFSQENILLSLQRAKDQGEMNMIRSLYGIP
jgi:hypothetical protein